MCAGWNGRGRSRKRIFGESMKLESCLKIADGRCETASNTIARLRTLVDPRYDYRLLEEKVGDHLYWAALFIDELEFRAMGKGANAEMALAGAYAEAAEWITAQNLPASRINHNK